MQYAKGTYKSSSKLIRDAPILQVSINYLVGDEVGGMTYCAVTVRIDENVSSTGKDTVMFEQAKGGRNLKLWRYNAS